MTTDQSPPSPRAFTARLREVLTARLPADPGWVVWVDGVVEELADVEGIVLSREDAAFAAEAMRRSWNTTASLEWNERREALAARLEAVS